MFDSIINKFKINKYSMIKHGTVACITMFGVWTFFGVKNIMIAFPIALTSTVMGRQNFQVKTFSKAIRITLVHLTIVTVSFISSQNLYISIPINFLAIFLIMFFMVSPYDLTFYKPFIMLYVFTQYASISLKELPLRYLAVIFGVSVVVLCNYINKTNEKVILGKSVTSSLKIIIKQIDNILEGSFDQELLKKCSNTMCDLAYRIYISRYKKYLTTNIGKIQFKIYMAIAHLNYFLRKIYVTGISREELECLKSILEKAILYDMNNEILIESFRLSDVYYEKYKNNSSHSFELYEIQRLLLDNIKELNSIDIKEINKIYDKWERTDLDRGTTTFKEYFKPNTIRFKFAMRMAVTLTLALFIGEVLGFYKVIWAIITVMSVMQPYYEDTKAKTKDRIVGNIIAMIFIGSFINIVNIYWVTIIILIISLYLLYAYKEYYKISLFASIASICIASLTENINKLLFYRITYVIVGAIIISIVNKILFPYKLKNGVEDLVIKITKLNSLLITESIRLLKSGKGVHSVRDIIIHSTLLCQKLYLRNLQYGDEDIYKFIILNNSYVIEVGYNMLMKSGVKTNLEKI